MVAATALRRILTVVAGISGLSLAALLALQPGEDQSLKAQGLGPVLKLTPGSVADLPLDEALRDPEAARHEPEDEADATRLATELKELRGDLGRNAGARAAELNEQAYQDAAALAYYFEDVVSGRKGDANARGSAAATLGSVRQMVLAHAAAAAKLAQSPRAKARALFHVHATNYVMGNGRKKAADGLEDLAKSGLDGALKNRALMIAALHDLDSGSASEKGKAEATLKRLAGSLPAAGQVAVRLTLARSFAGLSKAGRKTHAVNAAYRNQLIAASAKAGALSPAAKDAALRSIVAIWRGAEGGKIQWSKPPFKMGAFAQSTDVKAIVERAALEDWNAGKHPQAIRKYAGLSKSLAGDPLKADVDLRLLDLRRYESARTKNARAYEAALVAASKVYLDTGILGQGNEAKAKAVAAEITARYKTLVYGELARVSTKSAPATERKHAIAIANNYLGTISDAKEIEDVKAKIANAYAIGGQHREAVALYKELGETSAANAQKYWALAIRSQSVLAAWPEEAPWRGAKNGNPAEREELLMLYNKLGESMKPREWLVDAHVGLLELTLGRPEPAFQLWAAHLKSDPRGPHAANAAGYMLVAYQKAAAWGDLEALSRLCLAQKVAPLYRGVRVDTHDMLGLALLEGGKQAMDGGQFAVAVKKLKEFVANHGDAKRHDEGFFLLASAQRGNGQHQDAIKTLLAFVDKYPKSQYYRQALLNGGDWSQQMAFEENVIFFFNRFVKQYASDAEAPRVRGNLTELYLGRGLYAEAIGVLNLTVKDSADAATKAAALHTIMATEERHGSVDRAAQAATQLIAFEGATDEMKAAAYSLKVRLAGTAGRFAEVQQLEQKLTSLSEGPNVADAIGEARYMLAVAQGKGVIKKYFNLALKDPMATLKQRHAAFAQARAAYQHVCQLPSSSCAPAMHRLARLSEQLIGSLEDIQIQETLAKETVDAFNKYKQSIMNDAAVTAQNADQRAVAVVGEGYTDPDWVQAVLWQNSSDWNAERVSGETGNGYVQWATMPAEAAQAPAAE